MIDFGEHPDNDPPESHGLNKFLGKGSEGHRGLLLSRSQDGQQGIVLALTQSLNQTEDGVLVGRLYLVEEHNADEWPRMLNQVDSAFPSHDGPANWELVNIQKHFST